LNFDESKNIPQSLTRPGKNIELLRDKYLSASSFHDADNFDETFTRRANHGISDMM